MTSCKGGLYPVSEVFYLSPIEGGTRFSISMTFAFISSPACTGAKTGGIAFVMERDG